MPDRAARLWSPMPAALIWYLAKARRESGPPFSRHALRADSMVDLAQMLCCCELLPCFAFLMPQESDESKPHQGRRRRRAKEEQANAPEGEQEEANEKKRKQATSQQQQVAAAEGRSSNSTSRWQRRAGGASCSKPEAEAGRGWARRRKQQWAAFALRCRWLARCALKRRKAVRFGRKCVFLRHHGLV